MSYKPQIGRPVTLDQETIDRILKEVPRGLRPQTIAGLAYVHPNNLKRWLKIGSEDFEENKNTIYAHFWSEFNQKKANCIVGWIKDVQDRLPNWQATWELAKTVAREDFGLEAVELKELLESFEKLSNDFKQFKENTLQGIVTYGRKMDSESSVKEQGSSQEEAGSEEG